MMRALGEGLTCLLLLTAAVVLALRSDVKARKAAKRRVVELQPQRSNVRRLGVFENNVRELPRRRWS